MTASAIFLDVEGVLAPSTLNWGDDDAAHYAGAPAPLSRCALERFTALVESLPGALVVISSDWRLDRESSLAALFSGLHATGLSLERVAGCTRDRPYPGRITDVGGAARGRSVTGSGTTRTSTALAHAGRRPTSVDGPFRHPRHPRTPPITISWTSLSEGLPASAQNCDGNCSGQEEHL